MFVKRMLKSLSARLIADVTALCVQQVIRERFTSAFSSDLYHLTSSGHTSWYGFTEEIVNTASNSMNMQLTIKDIKAILTFDYPTPAKRPLNSQLATDVLQHKFRLVMLDWVSALDLCIEEISRNDYE